MIFFSMVPFRNYSVFLDVIGYALQTSAMNISSQGLPAEEIFQEISNKVVCLLKHLLHIFLQMRCA